MYHAPQYGGYEFEKIDAVRMERNITIGRLLFGADRTKAISDHLAWLEGKMPSEVYETPIDLRSNKNFIKKRNAASENFKVMCAKKAGRKRK